MLDVHSIKTVGHFDVTSLTFSDQHLRVDGFRHLSPEERIYTFGTIEKAFEFLNDAIDLKEPILPTRRCKTPPLKYIREEPFNQAVAAGMNYKKAFDTFTFSVQFILMYCNEIQRYVWTTYERNLMLPGSADYKVQHCILTDQYVTQFLAQHIEANLMVVTRSYA